MWSQTPIMPSYWATACAIKERNDVFSGEGSIFSYFNGQILTSYMLKKDINTKKEVNSKKYLNHYFFENYQKDYKREKRKWWNWIRRIEEKDYHQATSAQLAKDHWQFHEYMRDALAYFGSTRSEYTYQVEQKLEKIIKKYYGNSWNSIFGILTTALKLDDVQKEHLKRLELVKNGLTSDKILSHVSNFPWLVSDYLDEKKASEFLMDMFKRKKMIMFLRVID